MQKKGLIFDLDGVIVDTARFHFLAWKKTAEELGFELTEALNEKLKGVSRIDSLQKILDWSGTSISEEEFDRLTLEKNEDYLQYVNQMTVKDVLPGVYDFISKHKAQNYAIALGSASKNAVTILKRVELFDMFDIIVDGNDVSKAKPDPEVFLNAAKGIGIAPENCIVFEDSQAGIKAANTANMTTIGLGDEHILEEANYVYKDFTQIENHFIEHLALTQ